MRVFLSALGIAIGIAAMIAVVGISSSSRAELDRQLAELGTNLLTVSPGSGLFGEDATLPEESISMISRVDHVIAVSAIGRVADVKVYRNDQIPAVQSSGITVSAAHLQLLETVGAELSDGVWLNTATAQYPAAVLGSSAAHRLGLFTVDPDVLILVGGEWFSVVGILHDTALAPELDTTVLIGWEAAEEAFEFDGHPTNVYLRADESMVEEVRDILAWTANPAAPNEVQVSRPSDALAAKQAADQTLTGLLLGLGAVALLVGGIGVANTMVITVLERRSEIGLRRAIGATRGQIRIQFFTEALLLSAVGGVGGVTLGVLATSVYSTIQHWPTVVPAWASIGGIVATLVIGAIAGLYPAMRAARMAPTEALSTT
jgi:putative ABC transport system permease protein